MDVLQCLQNSALDVDLSNPWLLVSAVSIAFNPLFWNILARRGDYFGILMDTRVTSFPFNINDDPMYNGTTLMCLGTALWSSCPAGIYLSGVVHVVYRIALAFEGPFTGEIYRKREESRASSTPGANATRSKKL
ncbi:Phosphatidyl-N-methylethanolamine N-methyltransferase [Mortierella sp. AD032]|nr:Phosphatidyl-N-methylethanolamine N-methyltransferase [Mortierella sp. AD032]